MSSLFIFWIIFWAFCNYYWNILETINTLINVKLRQVIILYFQKIATITFHNMLNHHRTQKLLNIGTHCLLFKDSLVVYRWSWVSKDKQLCNPNIIYWRKFISLLRYFFGFGWSFLYNKQLWHSYNKLLIAFRLWNMSCMSVMCCITYYNWHAAWATIHV